MENRQINQTDHTVIKHEPRTLFGRNAEPNIIVASVAIMLAILALEFVLNMEMKDIERRKLQRKIHRVNYPRKYYNYYSIKSRRKPTSRPRDYYEEHPLFISTRFHDYDDSDDEELYSLTLSDSEKRLTKMLLALYFRKLSRLIESN